MALLFVLALLLAIPAEAAADARLDKPNVLLVMTDDQTADSVRYMPRTQTLLGAEGTTFDNSFVTFSLCCPSRATAFTGQYTHNHKVFGLEPPLGGYVKLDTSEWLPLWLQDAGYRTIHLGKFLNGYGVQNLDPAEVPPGFDVWQGSIDPSTYFYWRTTLNENGVLRTYDRYQTDLYADRASELIEHEASEEGPFFMSLAFTAPHHSREREPDDPPELATPSVAPRHRDMYASEPLPLPPSFNEADVNDKVDRVRLRPSLDPGRIAEIEEEYRQRIESLMAVDEAVEKVVATLQRTGQLDNTLIVYTSDNGFLHGEHRIGFGKVWGYEESIRVPLLMRGPGVPRGQRRSQLVVNADLSPTILDAADGFALKPQDGRSLFPLLKDPTLEWGRDVLIYGRGNGVQFHGIRNRRYKLLRYTSGVSELYDLAFDPFEMQNVASVRSYSAVHRELLARLRKLRHCRGEACAAGPDVVLEQAPDDGCVPRGRLRVRLEGDDRDRIQRAAFYVGKRRVGRVRGSAKRLAVERVVRTTHVRPGRRFRVRAVLRFSDDSVLTLQRTRTACRG